MANLRVEGDDIVLELSSWEKVGAVHGDVRLPKSALRDVRIVDDALAEVRGLRAPGGGFPGLLALGTFRPRGKTKDFVATYRHAPGIVLDFEGVRYGRIILSTPDGEALRRQLTA